MTPFIYKAYAVTIDETGEQQERINKAQTVGCEMPGNEDKAFQLSIPCKHHKQAFNEE